MTFMQPLRATRLASVNPVAKLGAAFTIAIVLLASIDQVSAGVALVVECVLLGFLRFPLKAALFRLSPNLVAAVLAGLTTLLYGQSSGRSESWARGALYARYRCSSRRCASVSTGRSSKRRCQRAPARLCPPREASTS